MPPTRFIRTALRSWLGRLGYEIYRRPHLPKGADAFESIRSHWPEWRPALILDVGANVGQSHARLRPLFPAARLICFEPVPVSFARLEQAIASDPLASAYPLALSDTTGPAWIHAHGSSDQSSMVPAILAAATRPEERIPIQTDTLAAFCTCASVSHIDLLKIDVEGHEMAVLAGAAPLLATHSIDFIVVEAGLMPGNPRFTPLSDLIARLELEGFWLVGIYEQYGCRYQQGAEFCNALFALKSLLTPSD